MKKVITILMLFVSMSLFGQGDCPAEYICASQANETVVNGSTNELNAGNSGCLASSEASASHWYRICALTAGTIQFTIAPAGNNNDYDFAVWNGSNCPPTTAPIRCSYALSAAGPGGDNTGVNSVNNAPQTDNSEGVFGNQWVQDIVATPGQCFIICINNYGPGSNTYNFTLGGTAVLDCAPLPIELLYFEGHREGFRNVLKWGAATETNNDYYTVERSIDGIHFETIDTVDGQGSSSTATNYMIYDNNPPNAVNYYRLKQTDYNGEYEYFNIIAIDNTRANIKPVRITNFLGQPVSEDYEGLRILYYEDGTIIKKVGK